LVACRHLASARCAGSVLCLYQSVLQLYRGVRSEEFYRNATTVRSVPGGGTGRLAGLPRSNNRECPQSTRCHRRNRAYVQKSCQVRRARTHRSCKVLLHPFCCVRQAAPLLPAFPLFLVSSFCPRCINEQEARKAYGTTLLLIDLFAES